MYEWWKAQRDFRPLHAWFDVFLDFLINFRPYKFAADGVISAGVPFALDLWLVTSRINAEIGARLSVLGPPMAGRVYVDFWVFGFDIEFGDRDAALTEGIAHKLTLEKFKALILKTAASAATGVPMIGGWAGVQPEDDGDDKVPEDKTSESFSSVAHRVCSQITTFLIALHLRVPVPGSRRCSVMMRRCPKTHGQCLPENCRFQLHLDLLQTTPKSSTTDQKGNFMSSRYQSRIRTRPSLLFPYVNEDNSIHY